MNSNKRDIESKINKTKVKNKKELDSGYLCRVAASKKVYNYISCDTIN